MVQSASTKVNNNDEKNISLLNAFLVPICLLTFESSY